VNLGTEFYGEKTVILAKSGYGKSYTCRVLIEDGISKGNTFIVIDPQDAYLNMPSFAYVKADKVKSANGLGVLLSQTNRNVVILMKKLDVDSQNLFLKHFLAGFRQHLRKGIQTIVIDELHKYAPERETTEAKNLVRGMFQENRSDGLGCIGVTQRAARLDKTILSQADHMAIGRLNSLSDLQSITGYLDNAEDIERIKKLNKGEFLLNGFGLDKPEIVKIRKSTTEHSGGSPKNLLNEDTIMFNQYIKKVVAGDTNMSETISQSGELINKIVPSATGFIDLAKIGMKMSLGIASGAIVGSVVARQFKSPIPVLSSRTLGGVGTTIALYAIYRNLPEGMPTVKDIAKYATGGAAAFSLGSLAYDVLGAMNVQLPAIVTTVLSTATGASPVSVEKSAAGSSVDTNTAFA
jgi:hypothetical protein